MAVSFTQQPASGTVKASDTPIPYEFTSDQYLQPNFSFIVTSLYNGVVVSNDVIFPERGNKAHYDASKVTLPATRMSTRPGSARINNQTLPTLQIRVAERYGAVPVTQPFVASNTCKVLKASCDDETYTTTWVQTLYPALTKWLTNAPTRTQLVSRKYPIWASILSTGINCTLTINFYNYNGTTSTYVSPIFGTTDKVLVYLSVADLSAVIGSFGPLLSDIYKIGIKINTSEELFFSYIDEDCGEFHQVSWGNSVGGFDQFLFTHNREDESAIVRMEYKKQFGAWNSANSFEYNALTSGDTTYLTKNNLTGRLYSGYVQQDVRWWLNEMLDSVDVILNSTPTKTEALTLTDNKKTFPKARFEELLNFEVNFKKSNYKSINQ